MNLTKRTRSGIMVDTKTGKTGIIWNGDKLIDGKVPIYIIDENKKETGEKVLCDKDTLTIRGFIN